MSDGEKLSKVDSADTDVEKDEKGPVKDIKEVRNNAPPSRKFDFDTSAVERLTREAEEAALRQIEREQAEALKSKLPDFWLPSLTPTYTSSGPPTSLSDVKLQTTCHGGNPLHPLAYVVHL